MANQASKHATLHVEGADPIELPVYEGAEGPAVIDVGKLTAQGYFTYDPGFTSPRRACESEITYIDGDEGVLLYRGYPIEQLGRARGLHLRPAIMLLLNGDLPNAPAEREDV